MPKFRLFAGLSVCVLLTLPLLSHASLEADIVVVTNREREVGEVPILKADPLLSSVAAARAARMAETQAFSHTDVDGHSAWYWLKEGGYSFTRAGENIAVNFNDAESAVAKWMSSEGHRANILNKNFEEIGVGVAEGLYKGATSTYIVQLFGTRTEQVKGEREKVLGKRPIQAASAVVTQNVAPLAEKVQQPVAKVLPKKTVVQETKSVQEQKQEPNPQVAAAYVAAEEQRGFLTRLFRGFINLFTIFW